MFYRELTFDDLPAVEEINLDATIYYYYRKANTDGLPENCYPEEEEFEITLEPGYADLIMAAYVREARYAIKEIEQKVSEIDVRTVRQWLEEEQEDY